MGLVRFDHIARECRDTFKGPLENVPIVGLEHIEPYDMLLNNYDVNVETTFTKSFKQGQILFGRRRAYQHKACVATIDGVCSGDITVIEPIEGRVNGELLPFIVQNDDFFEHAIKGSNGALSPRVKWQHMANYEVNLPEPDRQKELADKLWAAYEVKQSYLKMIDAIDELVKSRFIEIFGDTFSNEKGWEFKSLSTVTTIVLGTTPSSTNPDYWDGDVKWITPAELDDESFYLYDSERHITEAGVRSTSLKPFPAGTVILSTRAPIGKTAIAGCEMYCNQGFKNFICSEKLNPVYLYYTLKSHKEELQKMGTGSTFLELSKKTIEGLSVSIPPKDLQDEFEVFYKQADKSKVELSKSIEAINKVIKSLINENL